MLKSIYKQSIFRFCSDNFKKQREASYKLYENIKEDDMIKSNQEQEKIYLSKRKKL